MRNCCLSATKKCLYIFRQQGTRNVSVISAQIRSDFGYLISIMADRKQSQEFLGGGPKFNQVGRDARPEGSSNEPLVPNNQTGYWLRVALIGLVVAALAVTLFVLNDRSLGKTILPPTHISGHPISPGSNDQSKDTTPPPSLR